MGSENIALDKVSNLNFKANSETNLSKTDAPAKKVSEVYDPFAASSSDSDSD